MEGWVRIGDLAKQLGTSRAKAGQMATVFGFEKVKKNTKTVTHTYISLADAAILKAKLKTFTGVLGRAACKEPVKPKKMSKKKKESDRAKFERLFLNPIISCDFRTGIMTGQGLEVYWDKEREVQR